MKKTVIVNVAKPILRLCTICIRFTNGATGLTPNTSIGKSKAQIMNIHGLINAVRKKRPTLKMLNQNRNRSLFFSSLPIHFKKLVITLNRNNQVMSLFNLDWKFTIRFVMPWSRDLSSFLRGHTTERNIIKDWSQVASIPERFLKTNLKSMLQIDSTFFLKSVETVFP